MKNTIFLYNRYRSYNKNDILPAIITLYIKNIKIVYKNISNSNIHL